MSASGASQQTQTITLPAPHPGQQYVLEHMRRFTMLDAGRRWRKTTLGMVRMVLANLERPGEYLWAAPTYKQTRRGWVEMQRACASACQFLESRMEVHFPNGSVTYFLTLDNPENARSFTGYGIVLDEYADIAPAAWTILRPMVMDTNGWVFKMGTPKGRNHFWREFVTVSGGEDPQSVAIAAPTRGCLMHDGQLVVRNGTVVHAPHPLENPHIPFSEIQDMFSGVEALPERMFRQEILAEFLDDAGGVFRGVRECVSGTLDPNARPATWAERFVIGVDLAKYQDYTVCVVVDVAARRVVGFDRYNKADWTLQKERIAQLARYWNNAQVWMDATGVGDPIFDDLRRAGLNVMPYKFTSATKSALINNAVLMVEQRSITFPPIAQLVNELVAFEYQRSEGGVLRMNAPEGFHDDAVCAFALACWPLQHGSMAGGQLTQEQLRRLLVPGGDQMIGGVRILKREF